MKDWLLEPAVRKELVTHLIGDGYTQRQTAQTLGVTEACISQYCHGKRGNGYSLSPKQREIILAHRNMPFPEIVKRVKEES